MTNINLHGIIQRVHHKSLNEKSILRFPNLTTVYTGLEALKHWAN